MMSIIPAFGGITQSGGAVGTELDPSLDNILVPRGTTIVVVVLVVRGDRKGNASIHIERRCHTKILVESFGILQHILDQFSISTPYMKDMAFSTVRRHGRRKPILSA